MRKILIFQHAAHEILGTLNPLLKERGLRIRYVNFDRHPEAQPHLEKYDGLIVLGGNMGVYESDKYTHLKVEMKLIEEALGRGIPVLGICLGAQILARVLGAEVRKTSTPEIGWHDVQLTAEGRRENLLSHFGASEKLFQLHGDSFEVPRSAEHLARSDAFEGQAFKYGDKVFGLQFHLEVDKKMVFRWLKNATVLRQHPAVSEISERIARDTDRFIDRSLDLSRQTFAKFVDIFGPIERHVLLGSEHAKPR